MAHSYSPYTWLPKKAIPEITEESYICMPLPRYRSQTLLIKRCISFSLAVKHRKQRMQEKGELFPCVFILPLMLIQ